VPEGIRKYIFRKQIMLKPVEKLLNVNRKCQQMFKDGVDPIKIAEYYTKEKEKIEREQVIIQRYIRKMHKKYDELELEKLLKEEENKEKKGKKTKNIPEKSETPVIELEKRESQQEQENPEVSNQEEKTVAKPKKLPNKKI